MAWINPTTVATGDVLTAAKWNQDVVANWTEFGGGWTSYTPTFAQGVSTNINKTLNYAKFLKIGRLVMGQVSLTSSGAGTSGSAVTLTLPATAATSGIIIGTGVYLRPATANYHASVWANTTTTLAMVTAFAAPSNAYYGASPAVAVAGSDEMRVTFMYEAAS